MVQLYRRKSAEFVANDVTAGDRFFSGLEAPALDIAASTDSVNEIAVENTAVLRLSTDSEVNGGYTYTLLADSTGGAFRIEGDRLVIADTLLLDHETAPSVSITVRVTDLNGDTRDEIFELTVTDAAVERRLIAGDELLVNDTVNGNQTTPDVAALASGGYVVTWTDTSPAADGSGSAVKAQVFTAAGTAIGNEFVVNSATNLSQEDPAVTGLASGGFAVTWYDNGTIKAQIFDAAGAKVGGEINVDMPVANSLHQSPDIASVAGGGFVVAWTVSGPGGDGSGQAIRMQLFDAAGAKVGGPQIANMTTDGDQSDVAVAGLGGGGFVATWTDLSGQSGDGDGAAVRAQVFDAAGAKIGGEFVVNTVTTGNQQDPAMVALGSGRFVVTWTDSSGSQAVIKAQIFAADGSKIAGEIVVVAPPSGAFDSSVTALADGGFAVSWFAHPDSSGLPYERRGQMFDLNGHKIGGEFEISRDVGAPTQGQSGLAGLASGGLVATWVDDNGQPLNQDIMTRLYLPPESVAGPPILGTAGDELIIGTQGADVIQGLGGRDRLEGREGDDRLEGGEGNDYLVAGLGDDLLYGGAGHDFLFGGEDDDEVYGEDGNDVVSYQGFNTGNFTALLDGGSGDDEVSFSTFGLDATATLIGGDGNDFIAAQGGAHVTIDAGAGKDYVILPQVGTRFDISLGAGQDLFQLRGYPDFAQSAGTNVSDFTAGDGGDQLALTQYLTMVLLGWDQATNPFATGHLQLIQRGADAVIRLDRDGAAGGDYAFADLVVLQNVAAASLNARNIGFAANGSATPGMTIGGSADFDLLTGAGGNDQVNGLDGDDRLFGGAGNDRLEGGAGTDFLTGDVGDDLLYGGADRDFLGDTHGNDQLYGEGGHDLIQVDRQLLTGAAATTALLDGGEGDDTLIFYGRVGFDDAVLKGGDGEDLITAFGGRNVVIDGGDGPEIITIDVAATSYAITLGSDPSSSDIVRLAYTARPLTSFTILDWTAGNGGDMLQMGNLLPGVLSGWDGAANPYSSGHLLLAQSGADALILIDRDGGGNADAFAFLGRLLNVTAGQLTEVNLGYLPGPVATAGTDGADGMTGTGAPDRLFGLGGNDMLDGGAGADDLSGGQGDDIYIVDQSGDRVVEALGQGGDLVYASVSYALAAGQEVETLSTRAHGGTDAINLIGNEFAQTIYGNFGANLIDGRGGADVMVGFAGDDVYVVDTIGDQVIEGAGQGNDAIFTSTSYVLASNQEIETLSTQTHAGTDDVFLTGNQYNNILIGNAGDNILNGVGGADVMIGLAGDDTYAIDNLGDLVVDGLDQGNDLVLTYLSHTLTNGNQIETLSTVFHLGTNAIDLGGNDYNNTLIGNYGANYLNGNGGADVMIGLNGNDTYVADNAGDVVEEAAGGGSDVLFSFVSYTLAAGQEVETISTAVQGGTAALALTGNEYAQTIIGNAGANLIDGKSGNDVLYGLGGADTFAFTNPLGAGNVDTIADFVAGTDKVGLDDSIFTAIGGTLNANAFVIGTAAGDADDRIIYNSATGALLYDADGVGGAAAVQFATLSTGLALTASDFMMI